MSTLPLISVVIPAYQCRDTITRAIHSVLRQTYQNFEIVVVDNGSTDGTAEVLKERASEDPRIVVTRLDVNRRPAGGRNAGVAASEGEWIAFLDADDEWLADKLEKQIEVGQAIPDEDVVLFTDGFQIDLAENTISKYSKFNGKFLTQLNLREIPGHDNFYYLEGNVRETILRKNFINLSTVMLRKKAFIALGGFDERRFGTEDNDLWIRLARNSTFIYYRSPTVNRFFYKNSVSRGSEKWLNELINHHLAGLYSEEYRDLTHILRANLMKYYRYLMIHYGCLSNRRLAFKAYRESREIAFDLKNLIMICSIYSLPRQFCGLLTLYNRYKKQRINRQNEQSDFHLV